MFKRKRLPVWFMVYMGSELAHWLKGRVLFTHILVIDPAMDIPGYSNISS